MVGPTLVVNAGAAISCVTKAVALLVQPLEGDVIVTIYVPGAFTVGFCTAELKLFGPAQANVGLLAVVVAKTWLLNCAQVSTGPAVAEAVGGVIFCVTAAVAVELQPFAGLVTVS
jgi:hypothetical protein